MKVLIVEDDSAIAANLYDYLEGNGYEVDIASNGKAGLRMAIADSWDAILLDLALPGRTDSRSAAGCAKRRGGTHRC